MKTRAKSLLLLTVSAATLSGCGTFRRDVILHPIEKHDIQRMKTGQGYIPEVDGYFLSDHYVKEVMEAKIEAVKKDS